MSNLIETKHSILKLIKEAEAQFSGTGKALLDIEDYVAEYLAANGVIVPPCEVGDKVYWIGQLNQVVEGEITIIGTSIGAKIPHLDYVFDFTSADIGKTISLSKEEAEKASRGAK